MQRFSSCIQRGPLKYGYISSSGHKHPQTSRYEESYSPHCNQNCEYNIEYDQPSEHDNKELKVSQIAFADTLSCPLLRGGKRGLNITDRFSSEARGWELTGQWWSYSATQTWQVLQWTVLGGRKDWQWSQNVHLRLLAWWYFRTNPGSVKDID